MKKKSYNKLSLRRKYLFEYIYTNIIGFFLVVGYNSY